MNSLGKCILLAAVVWGLPAYADFEIDGSLGAEGLFQTQSGEGAIDDSTGLSATLQVKTGFFENYSFQFHGTYRKDSQYKDLDTTRADELWLERAAMNWDARLGNQLIAWGAMEGINLTDVLNPRDFRFDILEPDKFGVPMLRIRAFPNEHSIELYYLPRFYRNEYPTEQSAWYVPGLPEGGPESEEEPQGAMRYFFAGSSFDLGLSFANVLDPGVVYGSTSSSGQFQRREHRYGLELTVINGQWNYKGEMVYAKPTIDTEDTFSYALGLEYTLYKIWRLSDLSIFSEYYGDDRDRNGVLSKDVFLGMRLSGNDLASTQVEAGVMYRLCGCDSYIYRITFERKIFDALSFTLNYTNSNGYVVEGIDEDGDGTISSKLFWNF